MKWSRGYPALITWIPCTDHVADHTRITWLIMHWSRDWSCTDHVAIMHWSRSYHALITWLITQWSRSYHVLVMWLILHLLRNWSCPDHVADKALIMWLSCTDHVAIMHWSRDWSCTDHVIDPALITWLSCTDHVAIMHWSRGYHALITWLITQWSRSNHVWSCDW